MNKVYLLCGQVASGKSTYARTLAEREGALILSGDELLLKLEDHCQGPAHQREMEERIQAYFLTHPPILPGSWMCPACSIMATGTPMPERRCCAFARIIIFPVK